MSTMITLYGFENVFSQEELVRRKTCVQRALEETGLPY